MVFGLRVGKVEGVREILRARGGLCAVSQEDATVKVNKCPSYFLQAPPRLLTAHLLTVIKSSETGLPNPV